MKPLCIDLFCGLGGWTDGFIAEGYDCVGFDIERHDYGTGGYPGQLVLQDVRTMHGSQFREATIIVASPPCQNYSYMAMPWSRAKAMAAEIENDYIKYSKLNELFFECFRIQMEANEASGRYIPMVVENVVGAQRWVGPAKWHYGSFYLWGDVPALMPMRAAKKNTGGSWCAITDHPQTTKRNCPDGRPLHPIHTDLGVKNAGMDWSKYGQPDYKAVAFNDQSEQKYQASCAPRMWKDCDVPRLNDGQRKLDSFGWKQGPLLDTSSHSNARKAASAMIAKIPLALSRHIARVYKPVDYDMI